MVSRRRFRPRVIDVEALRDTGTTCEWSCGLTIQPGRRKPRGEYEERASAYSKSRRVDSREKLGGESMRRPYRKPTQVGEASSLR
jgi:hypothetical protein